MSIPHWENGPNEGVPSSRMIKWAVKLNKYDVFYQPRMTIKAEELAEFINDATPSEEDEKSWLLHVDCFSTLAGSGVGIVLISLKGDELEYTFRFEFEASNKEAKIRGSHNMYEDGTVYRW
ncbi:UNVERIFIED_CONTAM: hypothetical protein Scaly_0085200 [Sesamum calycinum]|uniref:Reverse transcriptase/retrotransposon-derived protein RNase H-like domain-containing protein n=1 Tax=Sesamum calycinum TaxID=2727403 RepID=A0AAW2SV83_9LAMI